MKSKFSRFSEIAISTNNSELLKSLYTIRDYVNDNLEIFYSPDIELMEQIIRILTRIKIECKDDYLFTILDCPKYRQADMRWFTKFFAYLESETSGWELSDDDISYKPSRKHKRIFSDIRVNFKVDISNMRFLLPTVLVEFRKS